MRSENLIRLHIIANSNLKEDQEIKLAVRDRINEYARESFVNVKSKDEAWALIEEKLPLIEEIARDVLREYGKDYPVKASLGNFEFPERRYGGLLLPAGRYDALKVVIGSGEGRNWWCVLFPPLCFLSLNEELIARGETNMPIFGGAGEKAEGDRTEESSPEGEESFRAKLEALFDEYNIWNREFPRKEDDVKVRFAIPKIKF